MSKKVSDLAKELGISPLVLMEKMDSMQLYARTEDTEITDVDCTKIVRAFVNHHLADKEVQTTKHIVYFILGYEAKIDHLTEDLRENGLETATVNLNMKLMERPRTSYYFVTSFRNLLTSYEKDFLKSHPFITQIIAIDPDFDEYEDLACDFAQRNPHMSLYTYDERAMGKIASQTYAKDQMDLIRAHCDKIVSIEARNHAIEQLPIKLEEFLEDSVDVGNIVMKKFGEDARDKVKYLASQAESLKLSKMDWSLNAESEHLEGDRRLLESKSLSTLSTYTVIGFFGYALTVSAHLIWYHQVNQSLSNYLNEYKLFQVACLCSLIAFLIPLRMAKKLNSEAMATMKVKQARFLGKYDDFVKLHYDQVDQVEKFKSTHLQKISVVAEQCYNYPKSVDIKHKLDERRVYRLKKNQKAA